MRRKKHDENEDLRILKKNPNVRVKLNRVIEIPKDAIVGIRVWGRIDFLTRYRGWYVVHTNGADSVAITIPAESSRDIKKERKAHKLTDKRK